MTKPDDKSAAPGHEPISISVRAVVVALVVLFVSIAVGLLLMAGLVSYFGHRWQAEPAVGPVEPRIAPPPGVPEVTADQPALLRRLRAQEQIVLSEYRWVDRETGVARIPIDRAMEIVAETFASTDGREHENTDP